MKIPKIDLPNISLPEFLTKGKEDCWGRSGPTLLSTLARVLGVLVVIFLLIAEFALASTDNTTVSVIFGTLIAMEFFVVLVVAVHAMRKI